ncbi:MAG: hypothetical protein B5M52_07195 [Helicobacteraceae bacterium 4484_230]|nr:MAG: hypothetical protein B5M52_07195 [Helicobacteraceae bacterium 4484_230]
MKRNMDLIKEIMLAIENDDFKAEIEGYNEQEVLFHKKLLIDAGYLNGITHNDTSAARPTVAAAFIKDITWEGYDFLELLKDDEKFAFLKDIGKKLSLEALKSATKIAITTALT